MADGLNVAIHVWEYLCQVVIGLACWILFAGSIQLSYSCFHVCLENSLGVIVHIFGLHLAVCVIPFLECFNLIW